MKPVPPSIDSILETTGRSPLVRLERLEQPGGPRLFAKCEFLGPSNSIFDRAAIAVLQAAERSGRLVPGAPVVAAGGTDASISLALAASGSGHPLTVVVPKSLHPERRRALMDYGAKLVSVDDAAGLAGAREKAAELAAQQQATVLDVFLDRVSVEAYADIGREIVEALGRAPDLTFCGLDLGAIPSGIARGLGRPLVAVEPEAARIGSDGAFGAHLLGGLAPAPEPVRLDRTAVESFEAVSDREAWEASERLSRETGILAGIASGAILAAALRRASSVPEGGVVVVVLPDSGERRFMLADFFG